MKGKDWRELARDTGFEMFVGKLALNTDGEPRRQPRRGDGLGSWRDGEPLPLPVPDCAAGRHRWRLERPREGAVPGRCRSCGETRDFPAIPATTGGWRRPYKRNGVVTDGDEL